MSTSSTTNTTSHRPEDASLTTSRPGFTIAPSPFNGVKFELGVVLVLGVLLFLVQGKLSDSLWVQSLLLGAYGLTGMGWIVFRTRQVLDRHQGRDHRHGA